MAPWVAPCIPYEYIIYFYHQSWRLNQCSCGITYKPMKLLTRWDFLGCDWSEVWGLHSMVSMHKTFVSASRNHKMKGEFSSSFPFVCRQSDVHLACIPTLKHLNHKIHAMRECNRTWKSKRTWRAMLEVDASTRYVLRTLFSEYTPVIAIFTASEILVLTSMTWCGEDKDQSVLVFGAGRCCIWKPLCV